MRVAAHLPSSRSRGLRGGAGPSPASPALAFPRAPVLPGHRWHLLGPLLSIPFRTLEPPAEWEAGAEGFPRADRGPHEHPL